MKSSREEKTRDRVGLLTNIMIENLNRNTFYYRQSGGIKGFSACNNVWQKERNYEEKTFNITIHIFQYHAYVMWQQ